jgi:hypothetical protein
MKPPQKFTRVLALFALLAALALLVAGCGGGGGGDTETTVHVPKEPEPTALTKSELITKGDDICAEVNAAVGSVASSAADTDTQTRQVSELYVGMADRLKELGKPSDDAPGYEEFIGAAETLGQVEGEVKLAAEREDTAALGEAGTEAVPALEQFESAAEAFGFQECSQGPSAPTAAPGSGESEAEGGSEAEEGGIEAAPEEEGAIEEEIAPEEVAPETGGAGAIEEAPAPEEGGETGGSSGGVGPG